MLIHLGGLNGGGMARIYLTRWHHREDMHNGDPVIRHSTEYSSCYGVHNDVYAATLSKQVPVNTPEASSWETFSACR